MSKWNYDRPILPHENEITKQREAERMKKLKEIIGTHCEPLDEEGLQDCAKQINDLKKRFNAMQRRICTMEAKRHNTYLYPLWVTGEEIAKENGWDCFEKEGESNAS